MVASLGKKSNEETMSPSNAGIGSPRGPSKRTRQSIRKKVDEAVFLTPAEIIQSIIEVRKVVPNIINKLLQVLVVEQVC